ncbi:MAG: hypothetical protein R3F59_04935 [Myxococcota bacterium]
MVPLLWLPWLSACSAPRFVAPPGDLRSPTLAGCTWAQTDAFGDAERWSYDDEGRLVEHLDEADGWRATLRWEGACLLEQDWISLAEGGPAQAPDGGYTGQRTDCDERGNPVWRDDVLQTPSGSEFVIASRSFVNDYQGAERVASVERWSESSSGDADLLDVTEYVWLDDQQPLQVRVSRPGATTVTTRYWWDHQLLLGASVSGGGLELELARTYDHRRLVTEVLMSGESELGATSWAYAEGEGFPNTVRQTGDRPGTYDVSVSCGAAGGG